MKKILLVVAGILCALGLAGCGAGGNGDAASSEQIFYDIYMEEEKEADPDKRNTRLYPQV